MRPLLVLFVEGVGINLLPHATRAFVALGLLTELDEIAIRTRELRYLTHLRWHGPVLHNAFAIVPKNLAAGEAIERARRLPHLTVKAINNARICGVAVPREWGGPGLDPLTRLPETCWGKVGLGDEKPSRVGVLSVMAGTIPVLVGCYALNLLTRMLLS